MLCYEVLPWYMYLANLFNFNRFLFQVQSPSFLHRTSQRQYKVSWPEGGGGRGHNLNMKDTNGGLPLFSTSSSIFSSLTEQIWPFYLLLLFSLCVVVPWWAIVVDTSCIFFQYSCSCENGTNVYFWLLSIVPLEF